MLALKEAYRRSLHRSQELFDIGHWTLDIGHWTLDLVLSRGTESAIAFSDHGQAAEKPAKNAALVASRRNRNVSGMQSGVRIPHGDSLF
jgi:hypothetical protein